MTTMMKTKQLTDEDLKKLSQDPRNTILRYEDTHEEKKVIEKKDVDHMEKCILDIWKFIQKVRDEHKKRNIELDDKQWTKTKHLIIRNKEWFEFQKMFPSTFERLVDKNIQQRHIDMFLFLIKEKRNNDTPEGLNNVCNEIKRTLAYKTSEDLLKDKGEKRNKKKRKSDIRREKCRQRRLISSRKRS